MTGKTITKQRAVALDYKLSLDDGTVVDYSEKGQPLWYLHGAHNIIPGLERELEGLTVGDSKTVVVAPADGYGEYDERNVVEVKKSQFPRNNQFALGDQVTAQDPSGGEMVGRIKEIDNATVKIDFNHELAGKTLHFAITVSDVRNATKEELAHGHVHGPGGHHH